MTRQRKAFALIALVAISLVLRPAVAVVGPLLTQITDSLSLSSTQAGILNAAPLVCFGLGAFLSPRLVRNLGVDKTMIVVLVTLTLAMGLRGFAGFPGLLVGTVAAGLSIASANVLLPTVVRRDFPNSVAWVTGLYTTILAVSASFAASSAVAVSSWLGGWAAASAFWSLPGLLAIALWLPKLAGSPKTARHQSPPSARAATPIYRSFLAWLLVAFFGIQSLGFYAVLGWLPTLLSDNAYSDAEISLYLGVATSVGIPFGLLVSFFLKRAKSLSWWAAGSSTVTVLGFLALTSAIAGQSQLLLAGCILIGMGQGSTFPISLSLVSLRAANSEQTTALSAMTQGLGYLISALGAFVIGELAFASGSWVPSLWLLVALTVVQVFAGFAAGRKTD